MGMLQEVSKRQRGKDKKSPAPEPGMRKVREVSIRSVKGGHLVSTEHEREGNEMDYRPPEQQVFTDHAAMMAHVHKATGGPVRAAKD